MTDETERFPLTATITETGPGGRPLPLAVGCHWYAVLPDGLRIRVLLTGRVKTLKTPVVDVGQTVRVFPSPFDDDRFGIDPRDCRFVSASNLERRIREGSAG